MKNRNPLWIFGFIVLSVIFLIGIFMLTFSTPHYIQPAPAEAKAETCPHTGDWTKIDSDDLSLYPVEGAAEYCFKAGQWVIDYIPEGGFGQDGPCHEGPQFCGLSHWSYRMGHVETPVPSPTPTIVQPTDTPVPTDTPEVTETPTEPTSTPTTPVATKTPRTPVPSSTPTPETCPKDQIITIILPEGCTVTIICPTDVDNPQPHRNSAGGGIQHSQ